jgi:hypothetical protein
MAAPTQTPPTSIPNPNHRKEQRKQKVRTDKALPHGKYLSPLSSYKVLQKRVWLYGCPHPNLPPQFPIQTTERNKENKKLELIKLYHMANIYLLYHHTKLYRKESGSMAAPTQTPHLNSQSKPQRVRTDKALPHGKKTQNFLFLNLVCLSSYCYNKFAK